MKAGGTTLLLQAPPRHWLRRAASVKALTLLAPALVLAADGTPSPPRQDQLVHMVRQDCGSCHGLLLNGGLGPPLTPEALADKPAEGLAATIYGGRPGTPMPPFRGLLSEAEADWIVEQLLRGFPPDPGAGAP